MLLLKFGSENIDYFPHGFLLQIGAFNQIVYGEIQDAARRIASDCLQFIDDPLIYFIAEFFKVDIFLILTSRFAVNIYLISCAGLQALCSIRLSTA